MSNSNLIGIVADVSYLYNAKLVAGFGTNLVYGILYRKLASRGQVHIARAHTKDIPGQGKFLSSLAKTGFDVSLTHGDPDSPRWVNSLAESIIGIAPHVNTLVLAIGDDRLTPIVEYAENLYSIRLEFIGFKGYTGQELFDYASDSFTELDASYAYTPKPREILS